MANRIARYGQPLALTPFGETFDQLFREAFSWPRLLSTAPANGRSYGFGSNLYETDSSYIMQIALPGVKAEEVQVMAHRNVLTLQGTMGVAAPEGARGLWVGLSGGEFREQVTLPGEVDADGASADYTNGILTLTLPKAEHARVKTIKVGNGHAAAIEAEATK